MKSLFSKNIFLFSCLGIGSLIPEVNEGNSYGKFIYFLFFEEKQ